MATEQAFKRYSRSFNIDLAPKLLFSKSLSVDNLIDSGVSEYLEFNNVTDNYFYNPQSTNQDIQKLRDNIVEHMVKIPFSKSEIFINKVLTFKEKR